MSRISIRLKKPIIQAGTYRKVGETVELRPDQVKRLVSQGVVKQPAAPAEENRRKRK